ncbi:hypothetical protein [Pigmentiphaga litoralis]|uniref:Preprotein translocase subunit SecA n=1 Tax=Pigmentiphaga litoralis TaxID=516702 RepID=A0A7Y9IZC0_9BURK|nr:hypothetical protein [Pigmentiphaga litoralis]NYE26680.1 preprotein translocase subunit SecA [Pigmentiphaga litoralis]NYE85910.1 preprotein translocase subunit SecA [Pigmentiphaga litoralis]
MIFPNPDAGARSQGPVEVKTPWGSRNALRGWWRVLSLPRRRKLNRDLAFVQASQARLAALPDAQIDALLIETRRAVRTAVARSGQRGAVGFRPQALALLAEVAWRQLTLRPEANQLLAALAMADGQVVELGACGGKTLAIALAAVLGAWSGRVCHVLTASELLAARDVADMTPLFARCGLGVSALTSMTPADAVGAAYQADVLYTTSRRVLLDSVRERKQAGAPGPARRGGAVAMDHEGLQMALVDDADRVLIDEASTPFMVSEPGDNPVLLNAVSLARVLSDRFESGTHYRFETQRRLRFTRAGHALLEAVAQELPALWRAPRRRDELMMQALLVRDRLVRGQHYLVQKDPQGQGARIAFGETSVTDLLPERTMHVGLMQAIEAREGLPLTHPPRTSDRLSYQAFFGRYHRLAGAASSLRGLEDEMWRIYGLVTQRLRDPIDTRAAVQHRVVSDPSMRVDMAVDAVVAWVSSDHAVLIGLQKVESFRPIIEALQRRGIQPRVLGAAPPVAADWVISPCEVLIAPEPLLSGADVRLNRPRTPLALMLPEQLESARAERAFWARGARLGSTRVGLRLIDLGHRDVPGWLRRAHTLMGRQAQVAPLAKSSLGMRLLLRRAVFQARRRAAKGARTQRHQLFLHEQQLRMQLAFAAARPAAPTPASPPTGDPHATFKP